MTTPKLHLGEALAHGMGDKRIDILRRIGGCGSISQAAREAGVSYKAAWQALETLANLAGVPLVEKLVGGSGGGGARLTAAGDRLLAAASHLDAARRSALAQFNSAPATEGNAGLAAMALRTSMRNQFPCTVQKLRVQQGLVRVELALPGAGQLHARITRESAQLLGLKPGLAVLALCKATAVRVAQRIEPGAALNRLPGTVGRITRSASGGEAVLTLHGGVQMVGFVGDTHGLKRGDPAEAGVHEAGVVIAVAH
jgi:molybdate transport system regulatory protein